MQETAIAFSPIGTAWRALALARTCCTFALFQAVFDEVAAVLA
jgi:hypothetical protein